MGNAQASNRKIRVLVVDDSALARKILAEGLARDPQIEVVGVARDPYVAWDILLRERPDVVTLDVEMPGMDGVTFLKEYMPIVPTPTVVVSAFTERGKKVTIAALEAGAVDVVLKPRIGVVDEFPLMMDEIRQRVKAAARANVARQARARSRPHRPAVTSEPGRVIPASDHKVIAIGASAGGVSALTQIIPAFPPSAPPILIVQHMPPGFTASFAERLNHLSPMEVREARDGDLVHPGLVLVAPGGKRHMEVRRQGEEYRVVLTEGEKVSGHVPSVDMLFFSIARYAGRNAAAAVLTGMGNDGAAGLLAIRRAGGRTFVQDEQTSVVFGMPRAAWEKGGAERQVPLEEIPMRLLEALSGEIASTKE
ncbi:MAG: chemotaxis response regulator protein-glutamate methylesterase [Anaerolineae bacterium]|nr:chemotaxis response regulator protein-glutamate methylesterase [Anaerolineae bacterium]